MASLPRTSRSASLSSAAAVTVSVAAAIMSQLMQPNQLVSRAMHVKVVRGSRGPQHGVHHAVMTEKEAGEPSTLGAVVR
jgi:hypothetical protein